MCTECASFPLTLSILTNFPNFYLSLKLLCHIWSSSHIFLEFPLTSLDLMDYCYVSDVGVANVVSMATLTTLSLSKTKLTDTGMQSVSGSISHMVDNIATYMYLLPQIPCLCFASRCEDTSLIRAQFSIRYFSIPEIRSRRPVCILCYMSCSYLSGMCLYLCA